MVYILGSSLGLDNPVFVIGRCYVKTLANPVFNGQLKIVGTGFPGFKFAVGVAFYWHAPTIGNASVPKAFTFQLVNGWNGGDGGVKVG